ncbi:MAG TPA: ECF-type sigma factor [Gemmataceae bacterium]|nr:ECF-type sigma factor [Gemmataceae bacterium]
MADVTQIPNAVDRGDPTAATEFLPHVYDELRKPASALLADEKPGQTLQPTALVHEAYVRLVEGNPPRDWNGRRHFFASAAQAMRRILVESARRKKTVKHGVGRHRVPLQVFQRVTESPQVLLDLDDALTRFADEEPAEAQPVQLRLFAGLSTPGAAEALGVSVATVERWWAYARAGLYSELEGGEEASSPREGRGRSPRSTGRRVPVMSSGPYGTMAVPHQPVPLTGPLP